MKELDWCSYFVILGFVVYICSDSTEAETCSGDTSGIVKDSQTCSELVTAANYECYNATIETTCCSSCNAVATNDAGCKYGDSTTCFAFLCDGLVDPSVCCATCATTTSTTSTTSTSTTSTSTTTTTSTTSTTSTSTTTSTTSASTTSATTSTVSNNAATAPSRGSQDDDSVNIDVIVGAVVGSVVAVLFIVAALVVVFKIYKRSKRKTEPSAEELPPKPDQFGTPARPELYSTPTMVVIDTREATFEQYPDQRKENMDANNTEVDHNQNEDISESKAVNVQEDNLDKISGEAEDMHLNETYIPQDVTYIPQDVNKETSSGTGRIFEKRVKLGEDGLPEKTTNITRDGLEIEELNEYEVLTEPEAGAETGIGNKHATSNGVHTPHDNITMSKERQESIFKLPDYKS